ADTALDNSMCMSAGCHDSDGPGANVADSYADDPSSAREGHQTQQAGNWAAGTKLPCTLCHNPHNTPDDNPALLRHDGYLAGATITTTSDACAFCHVDAGGTAKTIEGISVAKRPSGHSSSGCTGCHNDPHKPDGTGANGGLDCYDCHGIGGSAPDIESVIAKTYHHTVPSTAPSEFDPDSCLYKCHDDHPHSPKADNTNTSTASASNEKQLCFTCHDSGGSAPKTISQTLYNGSAHDYEIAAPGQGWDFSDSSYYRPNCSKCHGNDDAAGPRGPHGSDQPSLLNTDVTSGGNTMDDLCYQCHDTASTSGIWPGQATYEASSAAHPTNGNLLCVDCHDPHGSDTDGTAGTRNPSFTKRFEEYLCYECHTDKVAEFGGFDAAGKPSHHTVKDSEQINPTEYHKQGVNGFVSDTFVIECTDCHNPHIVTQTRVVTDPDDKVTLMSVADTPTAQTSANNWSKGDTTAFCAACHDGTGGLTASAGIDAMGIRAGTSSQMTGFDKGGTEEHESHRDDPTNGPCTYCHDSHGTAGTNTAGTVRGANLRSWINVKTHPYSGKNSCGMPTSEPGGSCHGNFGANDVLVVGGSSIAPASVAPSQTDVAMLRLDMNPESGSVTVTQIQVDRTGSGADGDVSSVEIWRDTAAPLGSFTTSDTNITSGGPFSFSGGSVTVNITDQTIAAGAQEIFFVVYDIAASPTGGATLGAELVDNGYVTVNSPDSVSSAGFPIASDLSSIGDVVTVTPTDVAPSSAPRGEIIGLEKLVLSTGAGSAT
ncbi:MAG: cytochrome c3 family protein, partial [Armatimonadota bacterium]